MVTRPQTTERRAKGSGPEPGAASGGGRPAAFEAAVLLHLNAAYTLARYLTRRSGSAEDIVQEALLRAYRSFDSQRGDNVRAWLLAIVRNCFLTWKARDGERSGDWSFDDEGELASKAGEDGQDNENPELILIQHEENSAIRSLVEGLPHLFREVLVLRDIEDMSYREIADITGVPIGTVMSRLARARKVFADAWKGAQLKTSKDMLR